jgi:hypothetical protein
MATSAERRRAQRRTAKQVHEGTYKPSKIGAKARQVAGERRTRLRDAAFYNIEGRLGDYHKYKRETVEANVYGGETSESGPVPGMDYAQAEWTANADTEELRSRAEPQYKGNPWFYH